MKKPLAAVNDRFAGSFRNKVPATKSLIKTVLAYAAQMAPRDAFEVLAIDPVRVVDWSPVVRRLLAAEAAGLDFWKMVAATKFR